MAVLTGAERNAFAQQIRPGGEVYETMPLQVLGYKKQEMSGGTAGTYGFNSTTARSMKLDAPIGLMLGNEFDSAFSIAIGPAYSHFQGYGTYNGPAGSQSFRYGGNSIGAMAIARLRLGNQKGAMEMDAYGNVLRTSYGLPSLAGAGTDSGPASVTSWGAGQCGLELKTTSSENPISISRIGLGMNSDIRNAFLLISMQAILSRGIHDTYKASLTPSSGARNGMAFAGMDIRPIEYSYVAYRKEGEGLNAWMNDSHLFSIAPGFKYEYNASDGTSLIAPYGSLSYHREMVRDSGTQFDVSMLGGYMVQTGKDKTIPSTPFATLSAGAIF